jgi:hypothetical protein
MERLPKEGTVKKAFKNTPEGKKVCLKADKQTVGRC